MLTLFITFIPPRLDDLVTLSFGFIALALQSTNPTRCCTTLLYSPPLFVRKIFSK